MEDLTSHDYGFYGTSVFEISDHTIGKSKDTLIVWGAGSRLDMEVLPDSILRPNNDYKEHKGRLFRFHNKDSEKTNREIEAKLIEYGMVLDSCRYKYKYSTKNDQSLFKFHDSSNSSNSMAIHPEYIKFIFKTSTNGRRQYYRKFERFSW